MKTVLHISLKYKQASVGIYVFDFYSQILYFELRHLAH